MNQILEGDCRDVLKTLADGSVHCVVTSPPYFGLRDYGVHGQIGLEPSPDAFVAEMVNLFREVRRVLRDDGTLWLNLGDSYSSGGRGGGQQGSKQQTNSGALLAPKSTPGFAAKQLLGIPWRVALALQADGWILRQDVVWYKPNPMPESVKDRCTRSHEFMFMFSKTGKYFYDSDAIKEPAVSRKSQWTDANSEKQRGHSRRHAGFNGRYAERLAAGNAPIDRNKHSVWIVTPKPFKGAHFATFPPDLIEPCILAGCPEGGVVLDPFFGSGTTGLVCRSNGRSYIGIELNPDYVDLAEDRIHAQKPPDHVSFDLLVNLVVGL